MLRFIALMQALHPQMITLCTCGACIRFAEVLVDRFPQGVIYYDISHAVTRIHDRYYDITGEVPRPPRAMPAANYGWHDWQRSRQQCYYPFYLEASDTSKVSDT